MAPFFSIAPPPSCIGVCTEILKIRRCQNPDEESGDVSTVNGTFLQDHARSRHVSAHDGIACVASGSRLATFLLRHSHIAQLSTRLVIVCAMSDGPSEMSGLNCRVAFTSACIVCAAAVAQLQDQLLESGLTRS